MRYHLARFACLALLVTGCSGAQEDGDAGGEGELCYADQTCDAGLVCVGELCTQSDGPGFDGIVEVDALGEPDVSEDTAGDSSTGPPDAASDTITTPDTGESDIAPETQPPSDEISTPDVEDTTGLDADSSGPSLWPCESSKDCPPGDEVCDKVAEVCVECVLSTDCVEAGDVCIDNTCVPNDGCASDKDCTDKGLVCDIESGACVECVVDADCVDGGECVDGSCVIDTCGNGELEQGEDCDDALDETPECKYGQTSCTVCSPDCELVDGATSYCGDGNIDSEQGEECDDGNATTEPCPADSDGECTVCQATCVEGPGASLTGPGGCPIAVLEVEEGTKVAPATKLHLVGSKSTAGQGVISDYKWDVIGPEGASPTFFPSSKFPDPTFHVNVSGTYTFTLRVWDDENVQSCEDAKLTVTVKPVHAIHVELLWHTPQDPDQFNEGPEAGADLDLHLAHPYAGGPDKDGDGVPDGWFHNPFDCFWFNPMPQWGSLDPQIADDPQLVLDDTDGAGPEIITLGLPEDGLVYRVGAHYWSDFDYGTSLATVRIFLDSELVYEISSVALETHDMWEVAAIDATNGVVIPITDANGDPKIIPEYKDPFFLP